MKVIHRSVALTAAVCVLLVGAYHPPARASGSAAAPVSEGSWLGESNASCSDETGTTKDYSCGFEGHAPAEFPPGSFCAETPSALAVTFECQATITARTIGKLGKAGCITTPPPGQLMTTNGTVGIFSAVMQQSYSVPVKVWVSRGVGNFAGVGNYLFTVVKVSGSFTTTCGVLQSRGTFEGDFTVAVAER